MEQEQRVFYHGTTGLRASEILTGGIRPRHEGKCNWRKLPGRKDCAYLTTSFGYVYAAHTVATDQPADNEGAVIEVQHLDESHLLPDEDFLFQCVVMSYPDDQTEKLRAFGNNESRSAAGLILTA